MLAAVALAPAALAQNDPVTQLDRKLASGEATLEYDDTWGYLKSLVKALDINPDTQALVFSKTSFQQELINPKKPRAIYFNDNVYLGDVRDGEVFELASIDPKEGVLFYTLDMKRADKPRFDRRDICELCHNTHVFVASVYPGVDGSPAFVSTSSLFSRPSTPRPSRIAGAAGTSPARTAA